MNVGELIQALSKLPPELPVILERYSDYAHLPADGVETVRAIDHSGWLQRCFVSMPDDQLNGARDYLLLQPWGNT